MLKIVAIIAIRNEEAVLANCLRHLNKEGIRYAVIDHGSSDRSAEILQSAEFSAHLLLYEHLPYRDVYDLDELLAAKQRLISRLSADWIIHHDADEMMHSYEKGELLVEAISRTAAQGYNVINFDEFVFLPIEEEYSENVPGFPPILTYYFHEPQKHRLMRAWKSGLQATHLAGHRLIGEHVRLAPESLALRHYIFRSQEHAFQKYQQRRFAQGNIEKGWHRNRVNQDLRRFKFPAASELQKLHCPERRKISREMPRRTHYWQWEAERLLPHGR